MDIKNFKKLVSHPKVNKIATYYFSNEDVLIEIMGKKCKIDCKSEFIKFIRKIIDGLKNPETLNHLS